MIIAGLDLSINSSGVTKFYLDQELNVYNKDYLGFTTTKKNETKNIIHYKKDQFKNELEKNIWFRDHISEFLVDVDYVGIEGYSYGSFGINFEIGEFAGLIKHHLYEKEAKIRIYDINTIKLFATGSGSADKLAMYEAFLKLPLKDRYDISDLPPIPLQKRKKGVSPTSDVVDSFQICNLLLTELMLRKAKISLKELSEKMIMVFNRTTKAHPTNILATDFLYNGDESE